VRTIEKGLGGLNVVKRERQTTLKQLKEAVLSSISCTDDRRTTTTFQMF